MAAVDTASTARKVVVLAAIPTINPAEFGPRLTRAVATMPIATAAPAAIHEAILASKAPNATAPAAKIAAIKIFVTTDMPTPLPAHLIHSAA